MVKSKKQTQFEKVNTLALVYKKFTDQQLINFINSPFIHGDKEYRIAVKNEIKRRGLKLD